MSYERKLDVAEERDSEAIVEKSVDELVWAYGPEKVML